MAAGGTRSEDDHISMPTHESQARFDPDSIYIAELLHGFVCQF